MVGYSTDDELHTPRELKAKAIFMAGNRSVRTPVDRPEWSDFCHRGATTP
jgi:hypothetical protein